MRLSTQMYPPLCLTTPYTDEKVSPDPRIVPSSGAKKGSKRCGSACSSMPSPVSLTCSRR
jgi:hypothetical protein